MYIVVPILIFSVGKEFPITIEDDKSKHDSVIQIGQQMLSGATVGGHGVIQQGGQSMCYAILLCLASFISHVVLRLFEAKCLLVIIHAFYTILSILLDTNYIGCYY